MKLIAEIKPTEDKSTYNLKINNYGSIKQMQELDFTKSYSVEIKKLLLKRSTEQNKFFWTLLHDITMKQNSGIPEDEWNIYISLLKEANIKYEILIVLPEAEYMLDEFRAKEFIKKIIVSGIEMNMWKCYIGQSKMDSKEMSLLIERALDLAAKVGCDINYWENVFKER